MAQNENSGGNDKKLFPGGFFFFLFLTLVGVIALQSYFEGRVAQISFSHQVEHLVNFNLIHTDENRKTASTGNLVSFSGRFHDELSEESRNRYKYLSLLQEHHELNRERSNLIKELEKTQKMVYRAADIFLQLSGAEIPESGYRIVYGVYDTPERENRLVIYRRSESNIENIMGMRARFQEVSRGNNSKEIIQYAASLRTWVANFNSTTLGVSSEPLKKKVRETLKNLAAVGKGVQPKEAIQTCKEALDRMAQVIEELDQVQDHMRLLKLRSVRDYKEGLYRLNYIDNSLTQNEAQLSKIRKTVQQMIWFFNNKELSTRALEMQDSEEFSHWFQRAKIEWDRFAVNMGAFFKAADQPNYLVLEKTFRSEEAAPNYLSLFFSMLPVILVVLMLYFVFSRQMKGMGGAGAMSFGKSPAKLLQGGANKITFEDVAGIDEAKEELQEIVDFLKEPSKFTALGAEIPKGVLCIGPPGTGKTLIAKAVAGEADRPFFCISGSDFVEMFVGVGASRIRDMFKEAKKHAPCIIFMDEIDAVGRHRGAGVGGGHDEREQTLNQLLVEMDGFDSNEGIILMAATNRPDVLDKALLRPGRFDRRVTIDLPDIKGRYEILKLHAKKIKMEGDVDLMKIARATPGSSGADLKNILNEAALWAVRSGRSAVTLADIDYATDKVRFGKERRSMELSKEEIERTAYHEAGHAIVGMVLKHCDPVEKVTVIPRGMALGATYTLPKGNRVGYWKEELGEILAMIMGGRAAEEIFIGDISSGAQGDIHRATQLARSMVCEWGMSEILGKVAYDERTEANQYLGGSGAQSKPYSDETAQVIDKEVKTIIEAAHQQALKLMDEYKEQIELMAKMLIEYETLDADDAQKILDLEFNKEEKEKKVLKENPVKAKEAQHAETEDQEESENEALEKEEAPEE